MAEVDVLVRLVEDALACWRGPNRQSRGCDFPSDHMEVLTFFHGPFFETIRRLVGKSPDSVWAKHNLPPPDATCPCYSCRTDAAWEAEALAMDGHDPTQHQFRPGAIHHVYWRDDRILRVVPEGDGPTLDAYEYLEILQ